MKKTVGIHQPNFLPWLGFFNKIYSSDVFVLIDDVQFTSGNVCNRCKIKNNVGQEVWFTVPIRQEKGLASTFNEVTIKNADWYEKWSNTLNVYFQNAPYFNQYFPALDALLRKDYRSLAELNIVLIKHICDVLQIKTPVYLQSEIEAKFGKKNELTLGITKHFGGTVYLSGQGAKKYNDHDFFAKEGIEIIYQEYLPPVYNQINGPFLGKLSIIDALFNVGENTKKLVSG